MNKPLSQKSKGIGVRNFYIGNQWLHDTTVGIYADKYNTTSATLVAGKTYTMKMDIKIANAVVCVWVDWNKDGIFESTEIAYKNLNAPMGTFSFDFVPIYCNDSFRVRVFEDVCGEYLAGSYSIDPCLVNMGDMLDFKIYTIPNDTIDLAAEDFAKPTALKEGYNHIKVNLKNYSKVNIDSATIFYQINGGNINSEKVSALNLNSCSEKTFSSIDSFHSALGVCQIKAWAKFPNGMSNDAIVNNDTVSMLYSMPLRGDYTIDQSQPTAGRNFISIRDAITALNYFGVGGHVKFAIAPGIYQDSSTITLYKVSGISDTSTLTIDGVDTITRTIYGYNKCILKIIDGEYITIKNLAFNMDNDPLIYAAVGLCFEGSCRNMLIDSCKFTCNQKARAGIWGFPGYTNRQHVANNITISNCSMYNMTIGVNLYGSDVKQGYNNKVVNNLIRNSGNSIIIYCEDSLTFAYNKIIKSNLYSLYFEYINYSNLYKNYIWGEGHSCIGLFMQRSIDNKVYNNFIATSNGNASNTIILSGTIDLKFYHNTAINNTNGNYNLSMFGCQNSDIRNNLFVTHKNYTYLFYLDSYSSFKAFDFNQFYDNGGGQPYYASRNITYNSFNSIKGLYGLNLNSTDLKANFSGGMNDPHLSGNFAPMYGDSTLGITDDFDGDPRKCPLAPTVGADESTYIPSKPVSDFINVDTTFVNSPALFINKGKYNEGKWFRWYVDGGSNIVSTDLNLRYAFPTTGNHEVKLVTHNCYTSDDTTKSILVIAPNTLPTSDFKADSLQIDVGETVNFTDLTKGGPVTWNWSISGGTYQGAGVDFDFINGTDSTSQYPQLLFKVAGEYTICLTTTNAIGSHQKCRTSYIKVYSVAKMCVNATSNDTAGRFYDEGGKWNSWPFSFAGPKSCNMLINPCSGPITIRFGKMNFDPKYAYLRLYDGLNTSGKLLNGTNGVAKHIVAGEKFTATSGSIYIEWYCKMGGYDGWEATWTTAKKQRNRASAAIISTDTAYINSSHAFEPQLYEAGVNYEWDLDDDGSVDAYGRYIDYTYSNVGNYQAHCYAYSCGGIDTGNKDIVVLNPNLAPQPVNFAIDATNGKACQVKPQNSYIVKANTSFILYDKSGNGPTAWQWKIVNSTRNYNWVNGDTLQNPILVLHDTGYYSIELKVTNSIGSTSKIFNNVIKVMGEHCKPRVGYGHPNQGITNFYFNDLNNNSLYTDEYTDYSNKLITCVESGKSYPVSISRDWQTQDCKIAVWIDYNQDGDFNDVGELVKTADNIKTLNYYDSAIKIPALSNRVLFGKTIMRVGITEAGGALLPCDSIYVGEFEDYGIYITDDKVPPVITLIGSDTVVAELGLTYIDQGAKAIDNIDGQIPYKTTINVNTKVQGYYPVRYDARDKAGNDAIPVYRVVHVYGDHTAPNVTILGKNPFYHNVKTTYIDQGATAYDSADGVLNVNVYSLLDTSALGSYKIWYKATDSHGNSDSANRTVVVSDSMAPVIQLKGNATMNVTVNTGYQEPGYKVTDNYDHNPLVTVTPKNIDSTKIQSVKITYQAQDSMGNKSEVYRWLNFVDDIAPKVTLNGNDTLYIEVKSSYQEAGAKATDNYDSNVVITITGGPIDSSKLGTTIIYYTAKDQSGNSTIEKRYVIVRKTSKPQIILNGQDSIYLYTQQTYTDQGVNFVDSFYTDNELRPLLKTGTDFPNPATATGIYKTWYQVTDPSGNSSDTVFRYIVVKTNGVSKINTNHQLEIYPNPTNNVLHIIGLPAGNNLLQVYHVNGQLLLQQTTSATAVELYTEGWPSGVYILKAGNGEGMDIFRFEVVR